MNKRTISIKIGKLTKLGTSRPLFSWRNSCLKNLQAQSPLTPLGLVSKLYAKEKNTQNL